MSDEEQPKNEKNKITQAKDAPQPDALLPPRLEGRDRTYKLRKEYLFS